MMLLPTKGLAADRCLLEVGAEVLELLEKPVSVSQLWADLRRHRERIGALSPVTYDWYVLSLDMLFSIGVIQLNSGLLRRATSATTPGTSP